MNLVSSIYHNKLFESIFPTHVSVLKKELKDCQSVLDLGCGPDSPLQYCKNIKLSIGVEAFQPYLDESQKKESDKVTEKIKVEEKTTKEESLPEPVAEPVAEEKKPVIIPMQFN